MSRPGATRLWLAAGALVLAAAWTLVSPAAAQGTGAGQATLDIFASVGSGPPSGVYYKVARALCAIVNRDLGPGRIRCSQEATPGSLYNLQRLQTGELEFALVQSDLLYRAYRGEGSPLGSAMPELRSVMALHQELLTIIAPKTAGIMDLDSLKKKRLNVGSLGSGTRASWDVFEKSLGWPDQDAPKESGLKPDSTTPPLCAGKLDAAVILVGHPSIFVREQLAACDNQIVPLQGEEIDRFVQDHPYFRKGVIPGAFYALGEDTDTLGVTATLVTTTAMDEEAVYSLVKSVLGSLDEFRSLHPALRELKASAMGREGLTAPLHPGAARAFSEAGLQ